MSKSFIPCFKQVPLTFTSIKTLSLPKSSSGLRLKVDHASCFMILFRNFRFTTVLSPAVALIDSYND